MVGPGLQKTASLLVEERLKTLGFRKRKPSIFSLPVSPEVIGLIGINKATESRGPSALAINPVVGVRHQGVERLVAQLLGEPFDEVSPFTVGANVGYLSPMSKYRNYIFSEDVSLDNPADDLVQGIQSFGIPFISANASLLNLVETMQSTRFAVQYIAVYRLPVAFYMLEMTDEASRCVDKELGKLTSRSDPAADRYRNFANSFKKLLASSKPGIGAS